MQQDRVKAISTNCPPTLDPCASRRSPCALQCSCPAATVAADAADAVRPMRTSSRRRSVAMRRSITMRCGSPIRIPSVTIPMACQTQAAVLGGLRQCVPGQGLHRGAASAKSEAHAQDQLSVGADARGLQRLPAAGRRRLPARRAKWRSPRPRQGVAARQRRRKIHRHRLYRGDAQRRGSGPELSRLQGGAARAQFGEGRVYDLISGHDGKTGEARSAYFDVGAIFAGRRRRLGKHRRKSCDLGKVWSVASRSSRPCCV